MSDHRIFTYADDASPPVWGWQCRDCRARQDGLANREAALDLALNHEVGGSEHGYNRYASGCRCDICRAARAEYSRTKRKAATERRAANFSTGRYTVPGIEHGGYSGYANHGCRCWPCTEAKRASDKRRLARKKADA